MVSRRIGIGRGVVFEPHAKNILKEEWSLISKQIGLGRGVVFEPQKTPLERGVHQGFHSVSTDVVCKSFPVSIALLDNAAGLTVRDLLQDSILCLHVGRSTHVNSRNGSWFVCGKKKPNRQKQLTPCHLLMIIQHQIFFLKFF